MSRHSLLLSAIFTTALLTGTNSLAQPASTQVQTPPHSKVRERVCTPNYELAERFSQNRINKMVFTTQTSPQWFRQGNRFLYSWKTSDGLQYYIADAETGKTTPVFDLNKLAMKITEATKDPFDAQHIPFKNLEIDSDDENYLKFDIKTTQERTDTTKKDKPKEKITFHFRYKISNGELTWNTENEEAKYPSWASISPDGQTGIYVKGANLYYMNRVNLQKAAKDEKDSTIVEHRITTDGSKEYAYGIDNYKGYNVIDSTTRTYPTELAWSPDSKHIAVMRWDMSAIKEFWVINALNNPRPSLETYKYQMPGEPGAKGQLYLFNTEDWSSKTIKTEAFKYQDLAFQYKEYSVEDSYKDYWSRTWLGDNKGFYLTRLSRDLKRMDICHIDINSDSTRTVIAERMNTYVEGRNLKLINGGRQLIQWSERNGWANLYLYNSDGSLVRNLTEGAYHVEEVLAVNEKEGYILFKACGKEKEENPYQMHTYRVSLKGGEPKLLDMADMNVDAIASEDGKYFIANCSRVDCKPFSSLYDSNGKKLCNLGEADFSLLLDAGYKFPERFKVKAADGITDLYGAIYKPYNFDENKLYPICDYVYPGPQVEANNITWSRGFTRTDRLAQLGFIVITVGNRGGHPNRSKWYHNYGYGDLRDYGLADQKYAIQQLGARYPWIDLDRVGIHGHSGGGFMSTAAILTYPDFFKAAVSCAGNHDNRIYNRWWSEQHHGIKEVVEKGDTTFVYAIETNQELAQNLKGHLLLCTGDIDDNVHPANTIRVINALIRANKRFDVLFLPGQRHSFGDMNEYFFWKMADWYCEWLMGSSKRNVIDIAEMNNDVQ